MKVFIVTEGEYSDYQIKAVFSTKEKAEKYIDTHGNDTEISKNMSWILTMKKTPIYSWCQ